MYVKVKFHNVRLKWMWYFQPWGKLSFFPLDVVVYSAKKSKDEEAHTRWMKLLELDDGRVAVHACQRHFPAGAPTRNHPDPNPNLFNPIPSQVRKESYKINLNTWLTIFQTQLIFYLFIYLFIFQLSSTSNTSSVLDVGHHIQPLFNTAPDGTPLGPNGQPLPPAIQPPPGSVTKLAPNATLIDLNKIKKDHDGEKPFKIEQVTVLIDETDDVKVILNLFLCLIMYVL